MPIHSCSFAPRPEAGAWRRRRIVLILLSLCACLSAQAGIRRMALVVGNNSGLAGERPLRFAADDASRLGAFLKETGSFAAGDVIVLRDAEWEAFQAAMTSLRVRVEEAGKSGREALILVYFSGHGSGDAIHIKGRKVSKQDLLGRFNSIPGEMKVLVLDACESGSFLREKGGRYIRTHEIRREEGLSAKGAIVLTSTAKGELAQESEEYRASVFSYHFMNGLRGLADANRDGTLTILEAFEYARTGTLGDGALRQGAVQSPGFDLDMVGGSDVRLFDLDTRKTRIALAGLDFREMEFFHGRSMEFLGRIRLKGKDTAYYQLPAGPYVLVHHEGGNVSACGVELDPGKSIKVGPRDFRRMSRGELHDKGGRNLFRLGHGLSLMSAISDPAGLGMVPTWQAGYALRSLGGSLSLAIGYGRNRIMGAATGLSAENEYFLGRLAGKKPFFRTGRFVVQGGVEASVWRLTQEVADGRFWSGAGSDPETGNMQGRYGSFVYGLGIPLEVVWSVAKPLSFSLEVSASASSRKAAGGGGRKNRYGIEPRLGLGWGF